MFFQVQGAEESDSDKSIGQGVKFQRALEALDLCPTWDGDF